jgi:hypothetical protein
MERIRRRTEGARQVRHARVLQQFWQTHGGLTWQDAVFASIMLATGLGVVHLWRPLWVPASTEQPEGQEPA